MGGLNESVLEADKGKGKKDQVLQADPDPKGSVLQADPQAAPVTASKKTDATKAEKPSPPPDLGAADLPHQYQNIRQHVSGGHCHFHDDANKLKLSIPVAEWYVILRHLRSLQSYTWVDPEFKTVGYFRPYIHNGYFDVALEMQPVTIGDRFEQMSGLAKR